METTKNLFAELNKINSLNGLKNVISEKYVYPDELKKLDSKNKLKANYRHKIQKNIISFLSKKEVKKEDFENFNSFLKTFIVGFKGITKDTNVRELYSFKVDSNETECNKVLNEYKKLIIVEKK
jgi:hypothetical protein